MELKDKRVLVTGATGFIGSFLTERLVKQGCKVKILSFDDPHYLKKVMGKIEVIKGDICKPLKIYTGDIDIVFHLAAIAEIKRSLADAKQTYRVNVSGTYNLLESLKSHRINKFIYVSTASVYGIPRQLPISETHPIEPPKMNIYAASKYASENLIAAFCISRNIDYSIVRLFNIYGPRQKGDFIVPVILNQVLRHNRIKLNNINTKRDFLYIADVIEGIIAVTRKGERGVYNIGSGKELSIGSLVKEIEGIINKRVIIKTANVNLGSIPRSCADISKIKKELKWAPKVSLHEGLKKTVDYWEGVIEKQASFPS